MGNCPPEAAWTPWHNRMSPDRMGDREHRLLYEPMGTCADKMDELPLAIEARLVYNKQPYQTGGNAITISTKIGLVCDARIIDKEGTVNYCKDYEVRYCCPGKFYTNWF